MDEATGDVYVAEAASNDVAVFKPDAAGGYGLLADWTGAATPESGFGEAAGVAVNNSTSASDPHAGDVYVVDTANNVVDVFKPKPLGPEEAQEGGLISTMSAARLEEPNAVTVDSASGSVYVADSAEGAVDVFSDAGSYEGKITGAGSPDGSFFGPEEEEGNVSAVGVDQASGDLYVAEGERHVIAQFDATGEWLGWITAAPSGSLGEPAGVAIGPDGDVYVADAAAHTVNVFGPGVLVPDAATGRASRLGKTTAVLGGVVDGDGEVAKYHFEWGETDAYGSDTASANTGTGEEKVSAELSGLIAGRSYHYRLVAENENGANIGTDREFTTVAAVEGVSTDSVQDLEPTEATVTGSLEPDGTDAHYVFEWGTTTDYGEQTESVDAGSGTETVAARARLTGLSPNTIYHYRIAASNSFGSTAGEDESFTTSGPPEITHESASGITHETATLNARLDPGGLETEYHFQYGESTSYGSDTPTAKLAAGDTPDAISAPLTGLKIGTIYHYRLVATNSAGATYERDQVFQAVPPALIEDTSASEVKATAATLQAQIDPLGLETTYYFQYGTEPCSASPESCTDIPAAPGEAIGAANAAQQVSQSLGELRPSTTYHYRVIAVNSLGTAEGPEQTLTTPPGQAPFALPDDRSWELVSPPDKHGAPVEALTREGGLIVASETGNSLTYVADGSTVLEPEGNRSPEMQQDLATRTPAGWVTQDIATPQSVPQGVSIGQAPEYQFFNQDLSETLVEPWGDTPMSEPPLAPEARQRTMYLRNDETESYLPVVTEANVAPGTVFGGQIHFASATPDLQHIVLRAAVALTGGSSGPGLYEWSDGRLQFLSMLPGGSPGREPELGYYHVAANAISSDGSRVIWTTSEEDSHRGHLYLRDTDSGETIQLDAAQGAEEPGIGSAQFQTANSDDSKVFFTDKQRLTARSTAELGSPGKADLYECEIVERAGRLACSLKDLTVDHNQNEHAAVQGFVLGASEGGSRLYLVAQGVLATNENGNSEVAEPARDNLYALNEVDGEWTTTFVAALANGDSPEWEGDTHADTAFLTARVSPNGAYLAFMSAASITGYDNVDANPEAKGAHDEEVYLYQADPASLTCVSCNPTGARPDGVLDAVEAGEGLGLVADRRKVWEGRWLAGNIPGWTAESLVTALIQPRYLSDEGRLFFDSADALVPQVTVPTRSEEINRQAQQVGVENVYEYEPAGVGSCESPTGGCVSLISSGGSDRESAFLEATPSGNDVFFLTAAQLSPQDTDTAFDIYDARVCITGSPCLTPAPPAPPGCDSADACRPAEPAQPARIEPSGSAVLTGPGNPVAPATPANGVKSAKTNKPRALTNAQKLAKALEICKRRYPHAKHRRAGCEAQMRRRYAVARRAKHTRTARKSRATHATGGGER